MLLGLLFVVSVPAMAGVEINVSAGVPAPVVPVPPPPPIVFPQPPEVVPLPDAPDVYVVPTVSVDFFFWNGWWWRPWEGGWYRSLYYDRGWVYFRRVPSFYFYVDPGWRGYWASHMWYGHPWNFQPIPYARFQQNWRSWQATHYWAKNGTWGVHGYHPRTAQERQALRNQRQAQYRQRPEVQRHEQMMRQQQRGQQHGQPQQHGQQHGQQHEEHR